MTSDPQRRHPSEPLSAWDLAPSSEVPDGPPLPEPWEIAWANGHSAPFCPIYREERACEQHEE